MNLIKVDNIYKEFFDGKYKIQALKTTSFTIAEGEFIGIIGPSGSGKSTLLTLIGGLQKPSGGDIIINNKSLAQLSGKDLIDMRFDEIGFILQSSNLIPYLTIEEQFVFIDKYNKCPYNRKKAEDLMKKLSIDHRKNNYPSDLSGGERQRAAIARALYPDPSLILADEPTASLDSKKAFEVVELLAKLTKDKNKATIMVTHDERLLKYCDRVFEIIDGNMKEK